MTDNLTRMNAFVDAQRELARTKDDPEGFLMAHAERLNNMLEQCGPGCPEHLEGLTAFDVADARDRMLAKLEVGA